MKVSQLKRKITVSSASWATGDWTVTLAGAHYATTGDVIKFIDPVTSIQITATAIAGTTGSTFKFTDANQRITFPPVLEFENYGTGFTGNSDVFSFSTSDTVNGVVHVVSNGTAAIASTGVKLQGSLDNIHWVDVGSAVSTLTAGSQGEILVTKPYAYGRLVFSGAISTAGGAANTIKVYRIGC